MATPTNPYDGLISRIVRNIKPLILQAICDADSASPRDEVTGNKHFFQNVALENLMAALRENTTETRNRMLKGIDTQTLKEIIDDFPNDAEIKEVLNRAIDAIEELQRPARQAPAAALEITGWGDEFIPLHS